MIKHENILYIQYINNNKTTTKKKWLPHQTLFFTIMQKLTKDGNNNLGELFRSHFVASNSIKSFFFAHFGNHLIFRMALR